MKKMKHIFLPTILALAFGLMLSCSKSEPVSDVVDTVVEPVAAAVDDGLKVQKTILMMEWQIQTKI